MKRSNVIVIWLVIFVLILLYCTNIRSERTRSVNIGCSTTFEDKVISYQLQQEEKEFPLAFSITLYTDEDRAIRLLRAIYRPHNFYCIHVDRKSAPHVMVNMKQAVHRMKMNNNTQFVDDSERLDVRWGYSSVLDADLSCALLLFKRSSNWKYWINLTGQEFPLRTNWELVKLLKALNGANLVDAIFKRRNKWRLPPSHYLPFSVTWYKGAIHVAVRYEFVDYMLNNPKAKQLYAALKHYEVTKGRGIHPDETLFATLNHNPDVFPIPGAFTGEHEEHVALNMARLKVWRNEGLPCGSGHWLRRICIFGLQDIPFLIKKPHLFANKFLPSVEPCAYDVLEMWYVAKTQMEYVTGQVSKDFNISFYSSLPYAKHHL